MSWSQLECHVCVSWLVANVVAQALGRPTEGLCPTADRKAGPGHGFRPFRFNDFISLSHLHLPICTLSTLCPWRTSSTSYHGRRPCGFWEEPQTVFSLNVAPNDVNDLPLDSHCKDLASDIDVLTANPAPSLVDWFENSQNKVLYPLSLSSYSIWKDRSVQEIRDALGQKATDKDVHAQRAYTLRASCSTEQGKTVMKDFAQTRHTSGTTTAHDAHDCGV